MTIDKADLVKRLDIARHNTWISNDSAAAIKEAITYITQQSQERDEVLEEAAVELATCAQSLYIAADADSEVGDHAQFLRHNSSAKNYEGAANRVRALKSPSPAKRRSEVEECRHEEGDSEYGGRGKCVKCGQPHSTPTAQPEPQGLVEAFEREYSLCPIEEWRTSGDFELTRLHFVWLLRELDRRAAIMGGK